jgi:hypothetical protein
MKRESFFSVLIYPPVKEMRGMVSLCVTIWKYREKKWNIYEKKA